MNQSLALSFLGFLAGLLGVYLQWGAGWALMLGGAVLFVAGGLGAREGR